ITGKQSHQRKHKGRPAIAKERAGKDGHAADGCEVHGMRKDANGCGDENQHGSDYQLRGVQTAIDIFIFDFHRSCSFKSQNMKPSRSTSSPRRTAIVLLKIGPPKTKVWNSPFSPQGSTFSGRSAKNSGVSSRPEKLRSSFLGSMQTAMAWNPSAQNSRASSAVSRLQMGKTACMPRRARLRSRYSRRSSRKMSPNATMRTPAASCAQRACCMRDS